MDSEELSEEPVLRVTEDDDAGKRLDVYLAQCFPRYSRVQLRGAIVAGDVLVDGQRTKVAYRLLPGQHISIQMPERVREGPQPEDIPLDVLYEDEHLVAVNKPANMVVHPSKGHWSGTLTSALAHHFTSLSSVGGPHRPGIVHRLDRETSGVIVVAKSDQAHLKLAAQFEARTTQKEYFAVVQGRPEQDRGRVEQPIGAHPYHREKMAIRQHHATSRTASTFYEVLERFDRFAAVRVMPKTGRTHQIRVHLAHLGCPVLCDRLYGGRSQITRGELCGSEDPTPALTRQALHAKRLELLHPISQQPLAFEAPLPDDIKAVLQLLK